MIDRLTVFAKWFVGFCEQPVAPDLTRMVEVQPPSTSDTLALGHSFALAAVAGALSGLLDVPRTITELPSQDRAYASALYKIFFAASGLREAGAGGSNPLTPTNENNDITDH